MSSVHNLPEECLLKKIIAALTTALNILLCKFVDTLTKNDTSNLHLINTAAIIVNVKIE